MKKEVKKEKSEFRKKIDKLRETQKGRAFLKLGGWAIFFVILLIFCLIVSLISSPKEPSTPSYNQETDVEEVVTENEITVLQKLINSNYNYEYNISINNTKYVFNGTKKDGLDRGYKESETGIIKYYIDSTGVYQETTSDKVLITNLYEFLNPKYLDINSLVATITNLELQNTSNSSSPIYTARDNINNYEVSYARSFREENNYISRIRITDINNTYSYDLEFTNVEVRDV